MVRSGTYSLFDTDSEDEEEETREEKREEEPPKKKTAFQVERCTIVSTLLIFFSLEFVLDIFQVFIVCNMCVICVNRGASMFVCLNYIKRVLLFYVASLYLISCEI